MRRGKSWLVVFELYQQVNVMTCLLQILNPILASMAAYVFDDVRLKIRDTVAMYEFHRLYRHILVVAAAFLRVEWVHGRLFR
jgi:hypothetical protein